MKIFRTDRGREFFKSKGIVHQLIAPYTEQNGIAEISLQESPI